MGYVLLTVPLLAVVLFIVLKKKHLQHVISVAASVTMTIAAGFLTWAVLKGGFIEYSAWGGFFRVDALSVIVIDIVVIISLMTSIFSVGYLENEIKHEKLTTDRMRIYYVLMHAFIFTMLLALTVKNIGIMWVAIEATTLASAFLVGFYNGKEAIEAAWKYIMICSVGIAIALLGIIFLQFSSLAVLDSSQFLDWTAMIDHATELQGPTLRLAFIFILVGFGTKAGLAPMHTWLPDAHSQAPSPISTLMSGVLLNGSMYGIIRIVAIVNRSFGNSMFVGRILIAVGILSVVTAAVFIFSQKDYKRLLAYSSIEHMGIIAIAIGFFTPVSLFGGLLHMINHSFTKSMLFLSTGNILQKYNTREISKISGLFKMLPVTGVVFLLGLFAIGGTPPFSVFASEIVVISAIFQEKNFLVGGLLILLLAIIFTGIVVTLFKLFYGTDIPKETPPGELNIPGVIVIVLLLGIITVMGLYIPNELRILIDQAVEIVIGG
ncbi:hydrogenase 4 subunit F [Acetobacterium fimetarium]|uniref:Hydrogenase 4 subunit F n=1 Tax=Acetobacterium fimetarium TaxID=52691 RepID=A0ABR6WTX5_9FIRM|nr:hydrogenase 4 subunit F [Acetobacterium fimetarium]MBC3804021.1 hydrogenase 4 subunit F [Acetobacterium fimetarium]